VAVESHRNLKTQNYRGSNYPYPTGGLEGPATQQMVMQRLGKPTADLMLECLIDWRWLVAMMDRRLAEGCVQ